MAAPGPGTASVPGLMGAVLVALAPGVLAEALVFGAGAVLHVALALATAFATEALVLRVRSPAAAAGVLDGSAAVTAVLVGVAVPAGAAWWVSAVAVASGLLVAKHAYGGLGHNPFNPAMAGYAIALVSFPDEMTRWYSEPVLWSAASDWLGRPDGLTGATPLDRMRAERVLAGTGPGTPAVAVGGAVVAAAYAAGGSWLVARGVIHWRMPLATLAALALAATACHWVEPARFAPPHFHLLTGGAILCAFFIVTDPVTAPAAPVAQWCYAGTVGLAILAIRAWGGYADGVAFAVLAANMLTPALDRWTGR